MTGHPVPAAALRPFELNPRLTPHDSASYSRLLDALLGPEHGVSFEPEGHTYCTPDGRRPLLGVTTTIKENRLSTPWEEVPVPRDVLERKRQIGEAAHLATHYDDQGILDESSLDPAVAGYVASYRAWRDDEQAMVIATELRVRHRMHGYAGTLDKLVAIPRDHRGAFVKELRARVVDLKCGDPEDAGAIYQLAAYTDILRSTAVTEVLIMPAVCLWLQADGRYPKVTWYDRPAAQHDEFRRAAYVFQAALTVSLERRRRTGAAA